VDEATRIMERNWQLYHQQQKRTALTGSSLHAYYAFHGLGPEDYREGVRVLEVGVGLGVAAREAALRGSVVSALDICPRALETVADVTEKGYLHRDADLLPSDSFDLITHHLVTQHMSDTDLRWQLPHVIRSLKSTGRLHIQWAGSNVPGENDLAESIVGEEGDPDLQNTPSMMGGRMCRSEAHALHLIEEAGGRLVRITDRRSWPQFSSSWFSMMVMKAGA